MHVQGPIRSYLALRAHSDAGLVAAVAATTVLFSATPFLLPEIVNEYGVRLGVAGLLSTAQVGAFALAAYVAGRTLHTNRRYLVAASLGLALANLASALVPPFPVLVLLRVFAGASGGILVWLAWAKAMRVGGSMRNVAAAGPFAALIGAPVIGWLVDLWGISGVFLLLAAVAVPSSYLRAEFAGYKVERSKVSPSRSNLLLVGALALIALAGSSLFVYTGSLGRSLGMSTTAISIALAVKCADRTVQCQIAQPRISCGLAVGYRRQRRARGFCARASLLHDRSGSLGLFVLDGDSVDSHCGGGMVFCPRGTSG